MAVATESSTSSVKSSETSLQNCYKSISSLANQIDAYIKNSPSPEGLFQPNPILLRKRLKDKCTKALVSSDFPFAQMDKIEDMLWNQGFYRVIQKCRNSQGIQVDTPLQSAYRTHLTAGIGFYTSLLAGMADTHHLASVHIDWNKQLQPTPGSSERKPYELYMYKILIHLGDLSRYQQVFTRSLELTKRFYYQAIILNPSLGHAFNQLGGMYSGMNCNLDSVYFYLRSLACSEPIKYLSEVNLKTIYDKNRKQLDHINAVPLSLNASENEQNQRLIRRFLVGFIRLQEIFFPSKSPEQNSDDEMEYMCSRVLKDFEEFLRIDNIVGSPNSFGNEMFFTSIVGGDPLFKICIISILTSQILRNYGSTHTPHATSFAISVFSLVLQNCYVRARKLIINQLDASVVDTMPDLYFLKLTALQIISQGFVTNGDGNCVDLGKNVLHIVPSANVVTVTKTRMHTTPRPTQTDEDILANTQLKTDINSSSDSESEAETNEGKEVANVVTRVKRARENVQMGRDSNGDLSEGNVSDSILSSRSNSSSSSGFEILGTDYSSEDEDNTQVDKNGEEKCDKPRDFDKLETPDVSPDKIEDSATVNSDISSLIKSIELTPASQEAYDPNFSVRNSTPLFPQFRDKSFDQESVLSTPQSIGDEFTNSVADKTCRSKPKILLAAKFTLEDDDTPSPVAETDSSVYISDILTKLCRTLQTESTLLITRAFSIWLNKYPVILATCAQKNAMLWSHLATLLNFLPSSNDLILHGVFPQHTAMPEEFSLIQDWAQSHPLYEDKLLYGLLDDDHVSSLRNIFTSSTSEEEQSLTRLIYLHRFGLLMAANKMAPAFTYDKLSHLFVGPAQKEVLDAKIAEETRLTEQMQSRERQGSLMKALAHQRLRGQVDMLKCQQQNLRESVLPFVLIPDALSLCHQLNTLKKLIHSNRFIVIIANVTLRILDEMKGQKQNYHARQTLRFIEHEFESNSQCVRPQIQTPPSTQTGGRGKRRQLYNPTISSIKELFEVGVQHSKLEESVSRDAICLLFDVSIIQNFLSPDRRTYNQVAHVIETAEQVGVTWKSVPDLFYKWMAQKTD